MADALQTLAEQLQTRFGDALLACALDRGEITIEIQPARAIEIFAALRDEPEFAFEQVMDVCGVDYSAYGEVEWATGESTNAGFSRGVEERATGRGSAAIRYAAGQTFAGESGPLAAGTYFTFGVELLYSEKIEQILAAIPLDRLLSETDNPGANKHFAQQPGTPALIQEVTAKMARCRQLSEAELDAQLNQNFTRLVASSPTLAEKWAKIQATTRTST